MSGRQRRALAAVWLGGAALFGTGCNALLGPTRMDTNWRAYESAHLSLNVRPGSFADEQHAMLTEVLEDQYAVTIAALKVNYTGRITAFLYTSAGDADLESNFSGVAYPDTESMRAVAAPPLHPNLFSLLSHEMNHVIEQNTLGRPGTYFMNEGLPSAVISTRFNASSISFLWSWTASHASAIPSLDVLTNDEKWGGTDIEYKAAASFLAYLLDRAGPTPVARLYQVTSPQFAKRIQEIYGRTLADLDRDWRVFCADRQSSTERPE